MIESYSFLINGLGVSYMRCVAQIASDARQPEASNLVHIGKKFSLCSFQVL